MVHGLETLQKLNREAEEKQSKLCQEDANAKPYFEQMLKDFMKNHGISDPIEAAYRYGYADALSNYGIYRDGTIVIGCQETPVRQINAKNLKEKVPY